MPTPTLRLFFSNCEREMNRKLSMGLIISKRGGFCGRVKLFNRGSKLFGIISKKSTFVFIRFKC